MRSLIVKVVSVVLLIVTICSCGNEKGKDNKSAKVLSKQDLMANITDLEQKIISPKSKEINPKFAKEVVVLYQEYARSYSGDSLAPEYLFKAGEVFMGLSEFDRSINTFEHVYKTFPDFDKRPECLYLQGYICDAYLNEKGRAKELYERVVEAYPNHQFGLDAKAAIATLTMSDEDLIKMFKEKNKEADS